MRARILTTILFMILLSGGCAGSGPAAPGSPPGDAPARMSVLDAWFEGAIVPVPMERLEGLVPPGLTPALYPEGPGAEGAARHGTLLVTAARWLASTDGNRTFRSANETWIELLVDADERLSDPEFTYEKLILGVVTDDPASFAAYSAWGIEARLGRTSFEDGTATAALVLNATSTSAGGWTADVDLRTSAAPASFDGQRIRWFAAREGRLTNVLHATSPPLELHAGSATATLAGASPPLSQLAGEWTGLGGRERVPGLSEWWPVPGASGAALTAEGAAPA